MKFGVNTFLWSAGFDRSMLDLLPRIKAWGYDGVEVPVMDPAALPAGDLRKVAEANDLECTACCVLTGDLSVISDDADLRRRALVYVRDAIKAAAEAGATAIGGPLYCPVRYLPGRRRTADEWKRAVEAHQSLGDTLAGYGMTLAIEPMNRFQTFFLNTNEDAAALVDEIGHPNIGVLVDTFHANIEEKHVADSCRRLGARLKHVHASENDRGTPGSGHVEWSSLLCALRDLRYEGWLTIESFGFALGAFSASAAIWRDIEVSPESIAVEGIKYLKQQAAKVR